MAGRPGREGGEAGAGGADGVEPCVEAEGGASMAIRSAVLKSVMIVRPRFGDVSLKTLWPLPAHPVDPSADQRVI
jgi:hypothetical protein